jgi:phenylacetic acid degradation operon negative regulatory protein
MSVQSPPAAQDRLTLSRRYVAGAESAKGLLFTVLGELALPVDQPIPTSALIEVFGRLGIEDKTTRQALARASADGWLTTQREGRFTLWGLTASASEFLSDGADRIYGFTATQEEWDGRWVVVLARAPETNRPARHLLRTRLRWAGFGTPTPGIWISTHADRAKEAERVLDEAGVREDAQILLAEHIGGGELETMVRQAWDLDDIAAAYDEFLAQFATRPSQDPVVSLVQLVHTWRRFPLIDPALPRQLLPPRWSGGRAATLFRRQRAAWSRAAQAEWARISRL